MTEDVSGRQVNIGHLRQVIRLLEGLETGRVSDDQMRIIELLIDQKQDWTAVLQSVVKVAYSRNPNEIKQCLTNMLALYTRMEEGQKFIIDGDADPFIPSGWKVLEHRKCGQIEWDMGRFSDPKLLYLDPGQKNGRMMPGQVLRLVLDKKPVLNANALDWFLANPDKIPNSFKGKAVLFPGTIYVEDHDRLCIRYLRGAGQKWDWAHWYYDEDFGPFPSLLAKALD